MCRIGNRSVAITLPADLPIGQMGDGKTTSGDAPANPQLSAVGVITMRGTGDHDPYNG
jgi:hypothetical protein